MLWLHVCDLDFRRLGGNFITGTSVQNSLASTTCHVSCHVSCHVTSCHVTSTWWYSAGRGEQCSGVLHIPAQVNNVSCQHDIRTSGFAASGPLPALHFTHCLLINNRIKVLIIAHAQSATCFEG